MKTYTEAKIKLYYSGSGAAIKRKRQVENFLYECTKHNLIIIKSRDCSYGFETLILYFNETNDYILNALQHAVNSVDTVTSCEILWKKKKKWRNPFKKFN